MTAFTYKTPTEAEIRAIQARALRMRAELARAGFIAAWGWLRSPRTKTGARTAGAH